MKRATPEEFITAWQTSKTSEDVAKKLKMPVGAVRSRGSLYRKKGIPLKKLNSSKMGRNTLDVASLAALAKSLK